MTATPATAGALVLSRVGKTYAGRRALVDVSTTFAPGQVSAVLGPNGAGKTTLLAILSTLVPPSTGDVRWGDVTLGRASEARARIGYVGHDPGLYGDLTARENLTLFAELYGIARPAARAEVMLARVGLADVAADAASRTFSRGMLQRLALARALLHEPDYLFLDEATASLDEPSEAALYRLLADKLKGTATVSIGHRSTLEAFHDGHIVLDHEGDHFAAREQQKSASAL